MAFAKKGAFTFNHTDQQDKIYLGNTATDIKQKFDSRSQEMSDFVNALIDALAATTEGNSGADNIGASAISGLNGNTIQTLLESMKLQLDNATAGAIPDFSLGVIKQKNYKRVIDSTTYDAQAQGYTTMRWRRKEDDTLAVEFVLSNKNADGFFGTDTWKFYDGTGNAVLTTVTWTHSFDSNGIIVVSDFTLT